ncbi:MAG: TonB-dependent receptor [Cyclobacteriaceae bacterium]|nr:TonB-dependent receptor [Cyclobacteriaceae bacterium]
MPVMRVLILLILAHGVGAQDRFTISGRVRDSQSGELLPGATVALPLRGEGVAANTFGFFSISVPADTVVIEFSYVGYSKKVVRQAIRESEIWEVLLEPTASWLQGVEILGERSTAEARLQRLPSALIQQSAMLLSEADVLKSLQWLPGVQPSNEGFVGFHVRGGGADQNLLLLDGVPVYNANHLFGFLSTFHPEVVKEVSLRTGGIPARYGERLSSVVDVTTRDGHQSENIRSFSISPISGQFSWEGPVVKGTSSFLLAGRRTWLDALVNSISPDNPVKYNFHDLNLKYTHETVKKSRWTGLVYTSGDRFFSDRQFGTSSYRFKWGNTSAQAQWTRPLSPRAFISAAGYVTSYSFEQQSTADGADISQSRRVESQVKDVSLRGELDYFFRHHHVRVGYHLSHLVFRPEIVEVVGDSTPGAPSRPVNERAESITFFAEDEFRVGSRFGFNLGLRGSLYAVRERAPYGFLQPRALGVYSINRTTSISVSYDRMSQFFHLLTNTALQFPVDLWVPSTRTTPPQQSRQWAVGLRHVFARSHLSLSVEAYHKKLNGLVEYEDGANFLYGSQQRWEEKIVYGAGEAKGIEWLLERSRGRWQGWLAYTLARATRTFADIDGGRTFPYRHDRRHTLSLLTSYRLRPQRVLTAGFRLSNGGWATVPEGLQAGAVPPGYPFTTRAQSGRNDFQQVPIISRRNNFELPLYHRLDISYQTTRKTRNNCERTWIVAVYNLYNQQNPFMLYLDQGRIRQVTLFPIIPSLGYRLQF